MLVAAPGNSAPVIRPGIKPRFPAAIGHRVAAELGALLIPASIQIEVAGSLRRCRPTIGDLEILYIPRTELRADPDDMFAMRNANLVDDAIAQLDRDGILERRKNSVGSEMFGPKNKFMRHRATGLPVDLFSATPSNWFNQLVCRTGSAACNTRICVAAIARGWKWNPYASGFSRPGESVEMHSEAEVFEFVGMPFLPPQRRE